MLNKEPRVAIITTSKNRSEFLIRQLAYYAKVASPHPVYIGDATENQEAVQKVKDFISAGERNFSVIYESQPGYPIGRSIAELLTKVKEKYAAFIGDDDFQIPNSLTRCALFLEKNPEYATVHGQAIVIYLRGGLISGQLARIKIYPQQEVVAKEAAKRLIEFMNQYYVTLFSVHRTEAMKKCWQHASELPDDSFAFEILPCSLAIAAGKSKLLDCLGFVRQAHEHRYKIPDIFDWISQENWPKAYRTYEEIVAREIAIQDQIPLTAAKKTLKQALWAYLERQLIRQREFVFFAQALKLSFRKRLSQAFPFLEKIFSLAKKISQKSSFVEQIQNPHSPYFQDFEPILRSLTGQDKS